jgi:hypothetical protein
VFAVVLALIPLLFNLHHLVLLFQVAFIPRGAASSVLECGKLSFRLRQDQFYGAASSVLGVR